ncbi:MAG: right-handed parallel beta-helix repeat-containing protein [Novosphingobium sp.]|nr:right-handed parallel beta-helix repeat-containing protein [Novosphingobium sp.]
MQTAGSVTYIAAEPGKAILSGTACEGKAGLVLRGEAATIDGLIFERFGVSDGNGAGIRLEKGDLTVRQSWFRDSEEGILTADDPAHTITIDQSTFTRLGRCDRGLSCAHSVYTGDYAMLTVTRSRFEAGRGGHYVKSRAGRVAISDSSFDDSKGHVTNYMIDLPAGATGTIRGNWFVQGQDKENYSCFIAVAAEAHEHSSDGLAISGNDARFAPGVSRESVFVADWVGDRLAIGENALGRGLSKFERR